MSKDDEDDRSWLDDLGESEKGKEPEKVSEEKEEVKEEPKEDGFSQEAPKERVAPIGPGEEEIIAPVPKIKQTSASVSKKCLKEIKLKLSDPNFISSEHLNVSTCRRVFDLITILEDNDGIWLEGRKTLDGFVIPCPIFGYSAMTNCYENCKHWTGGKNPEGVCDRDLEEVDMTQEKQNIDQARDAEIAFRQKRGTELAKEEES